MINNPAEAAKKDKTSQIYRHIIELEMKPDVISLALSDEVCLFARF